MLALSSLFIYFALYSLMAAIVEVAKKQEREELKNAIEAKVFPKNQPNDKNHSKTVEEFNKIPTSNAKKDYEEMTENQKDNSQETSCDDEKKQEGRCIA